MFEAIAKGLGSIVDAGVNWLWGEKQEDAQFKMARNAIQYRVEDAKKAGVHPLYALGAPTMSYSPVSVGGMSDFGNAGQDIGRALSAGQPKAAQLSAYQERAQALDLEGKSLDNDYKRAQLARLRQEVLSKPAVPDVTIPGGAQLIPGQSSTAQAVQDQYGDIVENIYGVPRLIYDTFTNLDKKMGGKFLGPSWTIKGYPTKHPARKPVKNRYGSPYSGYY